MSERKPNNQPWILLGVVAGAGVFGLFSYGFWQGFQSEKGIILSTPPSASSVPADPSNVITIFVDQEDYLSIDGEKLSSTGQVLKHVETFDVNDTRVILRLSDQASHRALVEIKGGLDNRGYHTKIEIVRSE